MSSISTVCGGPRGIVVEGLVLNLNAADSRSYPGFGTTWYDLSGNNNHATLVNGPTFNSSYGGSIQFDGIDDYVNSIDASPYTNLTIDMWIYDLRAQVQRDILTYNGNAGSYTFLGFSTFFRTDGNSASGRNFISADQSPTGFWYRFCYIKNSDLYINTKLYTGTGIDRTYGVLQFANTRSDVNNRLLGNIGSIKVYNRALSPSEILQNYNATKTRFGL